MKERFKFKFPIKRITTVLTVITLVLVALSAIGSYYFNYLAYQTSYSAFYTKLFDLNTEGNLPTLFSTLLLLSASVLLFLIFIKRKIAEDKDRLYWLFLSGIFFFLALDESLQIHEKVTNMVNLIGNDSEVTLITERPGFLRYVWVVPYAVLLVGLFLIIYRFLWRLPASTRNLFLLSGSMFVSGAVGLELLQGHYDSALGSNFYTVVLYTIEEGLEMGGVVLFIYALLSFLANNNETARIDVKINFKNSKLVSTLLVESNK